MVTDYLKHMLFSNADPKELTAIEKKLLSVVSGFRKRTSDIRITDRVNSLKKNNKLITVNDLGAGSRTIKGNDRQISKIANYATIQPKFGQLYSDILSEFEFELAIELGTSFGIGTVYLAQSARKVFTIEGCSATAQIAKETFSTLNLKNIDLQVGEFSEVLSNMIFDTNKPVFVYLDGNHQYKPTKEYFEFFERTLPTKSILIFDDIYWSSGMKRAWSQIKSQPYFTIDLYKVGILLLNKRKTPLSIRKRI